MAKQGQHQHVSPEMRQCAEECHRCHDVCLETIQQCLHEGGEHASPHHIRLLMDCENICHTAEDFMLRGSDLHGPVCRACAAVCKACAEHCDKDGGAHMKKCADACRKCADSCGKMAA